ncbi:hypothetical protein A0U93_14940 [Neoasaia chiangmaiensis]|uniref:Uncharacterized protein n=1 Tax=Neoasaia chiangmaiensis TaxID=320497 RepID=A0A1U9KTD2_9PROT|nr:hypothetical protein A0U93_14940 [Neoasaia chiangmaiensis]
MTTNAVVGPINALPPQIVIIIPPDDIHFVTFSHPGPSRGIHPIKIGNDANRDTLSNINIKKAM